MNKAITEGLQLTPPPFSQGLDVWSSGDGTPGSDTYENNLNAALVSADQDFSGCLEILKSSSTQLIRHMGQTPVLPGCYLRVTARVKCVAGAFPSVRVAAWVGDSADQPVPSVQTTGPSTLLDSYGQVVEVSAILGTGARQGVDMPWGLSAAYCHIGLDLTGDTGGILRIDDIQVEDITSAFLRDMMNMVDVTDYGAVGDGATDNVAAFEAADAVADGREVFVPSGTYHLANHVTLENPARFEGTITMPADKRILLSRNFNLNDYFRAFGDEEEAFKRALQVLFNYSDHESLDMCGRVVNLTEPVDVHAAVGNRDTFYSRRVIRNGEVVAMSGPAWDSTEVTSIATYTAANPRQLSNVVNVANIPVGSHVTLSGGGVGREVYVKSVNVSAQTLELSAPLYDPNLGTQSFTFTRYKYLLDFSGFSGLSRVIIDDVDFKCFGYCSGVLLPTEGELFHIKDCYFSSPKDRGITSAGYGCQGILVDRCTFISNESALPVQDRVSVALNVNGNDAKIRNNVVTRFARFAVMGGSGHQVLGNHWYLGDDVAAGLRHGGLIFTTTNLRSVVVGNYIDNCSIEWTNEHDSDPDFSSELSFGGLSIVGNTFATINAAEWSKWIVVKPYGVGHFISGMTVSGNTFRAMSGIITRVENVDTSIATLDYSRMRKIDWSGNSYHNVTEHTQNPITLLHTEASAVATWAVDFAPHLPFDAPVLAVTGLLPEGPITRTTGTVVSDMPYGNPNQGAGGSTANIVWPVSCKGTIRVTGRMDEN